MCGRPSGQRKIRFQLVRDLTSSNGWPTSGHANSLQLTTCSHLISHEHKPDASDEAFPALAVISNSLAACLLAAILGVGLGAAEVWHGHLGGSLSWARRLAAILTFIHSPFSCCFIFFVFSLFPPSHASLSRLCSTLFSFIIKNKFE